MKLKIKSGTTSRILRIAVRDSTSTTGGMLTGLTYASAGLVTYYSRVGESGATQINLVTATTGTWTSGGFVAVDGTNMPGIYELHLPNAVIAAGATAVHIMVKGATNMAPIAIEIELDAGVDYQTGTLAGDITGKVLGGGSSTITGTGVRAVDDSGAAIAPAATALSTATWTGTKAGYLDASVASRAIAGDAMTLTSGERGTLASAIWSALTSGITTAGSIGKYLLDHIVGTIASGTHSPQSGDAYARLGAPAGASVSADIAAVLAAVQANGGGTGANAVSITINDGSTVLTSARVRVSQGSESYEVPTNGSGVAAFNLDDATWTVRVTKPGYTLAAQTLVVDGAETVTYSMTAVSVSTPSAPNLSVGTLLCLGTDGQEEAGAKVYFRLIEGPGTAGYSLDATEWYETADADGQIEAEFIIGATYGAHRGDVGREVKFTVANGASFSLPENLGSP